MAADERHVESWRDVVVHYCERARAHPGVPCRCPCGAVRPVITESLNDPVALRGAPRGGRGATGRTAPQTNTPHEQPVEPESPAP